MTGRIREDKREEHRPRGQDTWRAPPPLPGFAPTLVRALDRRAQRLRRMARHQEAVELWTRALAESRPERAEHRPWRLALCWETARALSHLGQLGRAALFYGHAVELLGGEVGDQPWLLGRLLSDLAEVHRRRGEPLLARSLAERALALTRRAAAGRASSLLPLSRLGRLYAEAGAYEDAERCFGEALRIAHDVGGPSHPDYGGCLSNLAELYRSTGRYREALFHYRRRLAWCREHLGPHHPEATLTLVALADLHLSRRTFARAAVLYRSAWRLGSTPPARGRPAITELDQEDDPNKGAPTQLYPAETFPERPSAATRHRGERSIMPDPPTLATAPTTGTEPIAEPEAPALPSAVGPPVTADANAEQEPPRIEAEAPACEQVWSAALTELRAVLEARFDALRQAFHEKLAFDTHKERQIDLLHRELQEHKRGLLAQATRPLVAGLVRLHDDLGRAAADLAASPAEDVTSERSIRLLSGFQGDVEILLEASGVTRFQEPAERFDPHRQTARQTIGTAERDQVGAVARRLRPGFEQDGHLVMKERVEVYVLALGGARPGGGMSRDVPPEPASADPPSNDRTDP
jgi:tetratricopeptide (TPR) repeat protein/molecular chaperone GrpE (heat shock protein)